LVIVPVLQGRQAPAGTDGKPGHGHSPADRLAEAVGLAQAIDLAVIDQSIVSVASVRPATLLGTGKVEELKHAVEHERIGLVIIDHALTPIQQRNLERAWNTKVLDRTGLILEIFGRRARTREGRLQVELAHLTFQRSRLVRSWTHLERQRGGFGFLGGPGETQIETDRRLLQERIHKIEQELAKVTRTRALHRKGRRQVPFPVVAIVGYTNAGKSTLFNRLTEAGVLAKDQVFATLDPTMRELVLASGRRVILSDTVGFISDLPTMLVAAFRATLEEVVEADLILHVRDISHAESDAQRADVEAILNDLRVATDGPDCRVIEVWNKIDLLTDDERELLGEQARRHDPRAVLISAHSGEGCAALCETIDAWVGRGDVDMTLDLPTTAGRVVNWVHENAHVISQDITPVGSTRLTFRIAGEKLGRLNGLLKSSGVYGDTTGSPGDAA
jgi:GTP-binding protein HflX